jgi:sugar-specific transcriptional regulator TrmB
MIKETLIDIGLTKNEVKIYLTLLNKGELSVNEIGTKSGLHRQVCYDALDRLVEKGFISYINKNGKKYFKALNPKKIIHYLDEQKEEIETKEKRINDILPQLSDLFVEEQGTTHVEVVKGKNVLRTIYKDIFETIIKDKSSLLAMGVDEEKFLDFDKIAITQYIAKMQRSKLKEKLLSKESATIFFEGSQSKYRLLPNHLFNPNPIQIYGDKVATIVWGEPMHGIIMESKQVADAYRKYFQILWDMAKERKL